ncbi:hypothetical protein B0H12DRAFT_1075179 [Mycena haematopus]|nr:hypothetical protein B0H12DRAFT_1075179 [Mycena haematopus]
MTGKMGPEEVREWEDEGGELIRTGGRPKRQRRPQRTRKSEMRNRKSAEKQVLELCQKAEMKGRPRIRLTAGCGGGNDHGKPGNGECEAERVRRKGGSEEDTTTRIGNRPRRLHRPRANPEIGGRKGEGKEHPIVQAGGRPNWQRRPHGTRNSEMRSCDRKMKSDFKEEFPAGNERKNKPQEGAEGGGW